MRSYEYNGLRAGTRIKLDGREGFLVSDAGYEMLGGRMGAFVAWVKFDDGLLEHKILNKGELEVLR